MSVHPGAVPIAQQRPASPVAGSPFDSAGDRGWERDEDGFAALAADLQHPVAVFLAEVGDVPEVGICLGCAQYLYRRRTERLDRRKRSLAAEIPDMFRVARAAVIARGWADRPGIGPVLRWIDRRLP
jgi:hypothetical protein